MSFAKLGLSAPLLSAINKQGFETPFSIQEQAIPAILKGKDIQGLGPTGSGKTASFVLPILELFQQKNKERDLKLKVLVLVPTRELAIQISEVFTLFSEHLPNQVKNLAVFGGVPLNQQMVKLKHTEILIATPGRLLDLVSTNSIHLGKIEMLVIDEADKMLDDAFKTELSDILRLIPAKRQNILFSATLNPVLDVLQKDILSQPTIIEVLPEKKEIDQIEQLAYLVKSERKGPFLRYLINENNYTQVLVFVSSIRTADNVCTKLKKNGINAMAFHSKKSQNARIEALNSFKNGKTTVLVATDLASRGIDIQFLPVVVNYELPRSPKDYIHRIGRTGRANESGTAITLYTDEEEHHFYIIQKKMGKKVPKIDSETIDFGF